MATPITKQHQCIFYTVKQENPSSQLDVKNLFNTIKDIDTALYKDQKWLVLHLPAIQAVSPNFCSTLCRISTYAEQYNLKFSIIAEPKICNLIIKNGIERMVYFATSTAEFYKNNGIDSSVSTTKDKALVFLNCLLESTLTTMKVLLELNQIKNEVSIITDSAKIPNIQVGAMAGIVSANFKGNLVIGFTLDVFKNAMSRFLQMEVTEMTPEMRDGAAEFLNVIIGQTRTKLSTSGFVINQVIPSVIIGEKIEISPISRQTFIMIKCITDIGEIHLFLATNSSEDN